MCWTAFRAALWQTSVDSMSKSCVLPISKHVTHAGQMCLDLSVLRCWWGFMLICRNTIGKPPSLQAQRRQVRLGSPTCTFLGYRNQSTPSHFYQYLSPSTLSVSYRHFTSTMSAPGTCTISLACTNMCQDRSTAARRAWESTSS